MADEEFKSDMRTIASKLFDEGFGTAVGIVEKIRDHIATEPTIDEEYRRVSVETLNITIKKLRGSVKRD